MPVSAEERFYSHVKKSESCWLWTASTTKNGYGRFAVSHERTQVAHRWLWEQTNGPVPEGLELDHVCKVKHCVNPDHLEPVTRSENQWRNHSPICAQGHLKDRHNSQGYLICSECSRQAVRRYRAKVA